MKLLSRALQGAPLVNCLSDLIDAARSLNAQQRFAHASVASQMSNEAWALSYATVRVNIGRQTGNTTYICDNATDDCLVVCVNWALAVHVKREMSMRGKNPIVVAPAGLATVTHSTVGMQFDTIFVDDASWQSQHTLDAVYTVARGDIHQQFILLG